MLVLVLVLVLCGWSGAVFSSCIAGAETPCGTYKLWRILLLVSCTHARVASSSTHGCNVSCDCVVFGHDRYSIDTSNLFYEYTVAKGKLVSVNVKAVNAIGTGPQGTPPTAIPSIGE
jgi:hypothetical protein